MIGCHADDSYFSFAEDFISNTISVRDLNESMQLGSLGEQVVLISQKSYSQIEFTGFELSDYRKYYFARSQRDSQARADYRQRKKNLTSLKDDLHEADILPALAMALKCNMADLLD